MTPTRLFDFLDWQLQKFPQEDMLAAKENGGVFEKSRGVEAGDIRGHW